LRILLLWHYYDNYIRQFYADHLGLAGASYIEQQTTLLDDYFGWPGYLVRAFRTLGHEAQIIFGNVEPLQAAWAREYGVPIQAESGRTELLQHQTRLYRPDVLFVGAIFEYWGAFLHRVRDCCGTIFLWIASPLPKHLEIGPVDCILSSFPHFVERFRDQGLTSEFFQAACFDPGILNILPVLPRDLPATFVGGLSPTIFKRRIDTLSYASRRTPLQIWGYGLSGRWPRHPKRALNHLLWLAKMLSIRRHYQGEVYGLDFFKILARSLITLNIHIDTAEGVASNMRLFEATGCGTMLITEQSPVLSQFFEPDREVVTFDSKVDLVEKIKYYLGREAELERIAMAGRQRTLEKHSAVQRAKEFISVVQRYRSC
jgi:glycosyltransferase involved in cell wall biosynthesis